MALFGVKTTGCVTLLILLAAIFYRKRADFISQERLHDILSGLLRAERKVSSSASRVALGFGGCVDVLVDALDLFHRLDSVPPETAEHVDRVESMEELEKLFAYFFQHGAAAERYVHNKTLFTEITESIDAEPSIRKRSYIAGAAPVMAKRLAEEGIEVLVGGRFTPTSQAEFHEKIQVAGDNLEQDDLHLILEYKVGDTWGKYTSPRANRLILHSDRSSPYLEALESFQKELDHFKPALLIVGGLQMMDNFPFKSGEREARLSKLESLLKMTPSSTKIHFEMASFTDESVIQDLIKYVVPYADSLGMNEQELPNFLSILTGGEIQLISDAYPRVANVLDQMRDVYTIIRQKERNLNIGQRTLTRLHIHTLAYQAILVTKGSSWKNTMSATAKASLTANRFICGNDDVDTMKARILMDDSFSTSRDESKRKMPLHAHRPVSCWEEQDYLICVAPVLVCTDVHQTAGGGDNISSAGLVLQI